MKTKCFSLVLSAGILVAGIAHAGTVDVGSGNNGKKALTEEVSSLMALDTKFEGRIVKTTSKGEIVTSAKCSVIASQQDGKLVVEISKGKKATRFQAANDGNDLLLEPSFMNPDGMGVELSIINKFASATQNLVIRTNEAGAVVSISQKPDSDFDVKPTEISCALSRGN